MNINTLKSIIVTLLDINQDQNSNISHLTQRQANTESKVTGHDNSLYKLSERILELERYPRKLCLIFNNIDIGDDPTGLSNVFSLLNNRLQINLTPQDLAACYPLANRHIASVIMKFIYHSHVNSILRRSSWLKGIVNSQGRRITSKQWLAPSDWKVKAEARKMKLFRVCAKRQLFRLECNWSERCQWTPWISSTPRELFSKLNPLR